MSTTDRTGDVLDWHDAKRAALLAEAREHLGPNARAGRPALDTDRVKGTERVLEYWRSVSNGQWNEWQIKQQAASEEWCGVWALSRYRAAGLTEAPWILGSGFSRRLPPTKAPTPGDLVVFPRMWHHAIVVSLKDTTLVTLDGNQPDIRERTRVAPVVYKYYSIQPWLDAALEREQRALEAGEILPPGVG